jgi:hypothetical protein|uniref:Uncharacterized protein n=1 Tax=Rhodopseudomonas palustris (strain BisA53) TaxID=316055 RepID=Q07K55_RHOP5
MKTARIVVLAPAFGAGSMAARAGMQAPTLDVPVTESDIAIGHSAGPGNNLIRRTERADNGSQVAGAIALALAHARRFDRHFDHDNDAELSRGPT